MLSSSSLQPPFSRICLDTPSSSWNTCAHDAHASFFKPQKDPLIRNCDRSRVFPPGLLKVYTSLGLYVVHRPNSAFTGPFDLSSPLPPSSNGKGRPDEPSRFRRVDSAGRNPSEFRIRKEGGGNRASAPGQLLRKSATGSQRPPISRARPQSHNEANILRANRTALRGTPTQRRRAVAEEDENLDEDEDDLITFASEEEEVAFYEKQLSENMDELDDRDIVVMESRLKLLTEKDVLTREQRSILKSLGDSDAVAIMSEQEMNTFLERLNAITKRQNEEQGEDEASEEEQEIAYLLEELNKNSSRLSENQVTAMESRLKLLVESDTLTDEQRSLLKSLTAENMATMSQEKIDSTLQRINTLTNQEQKDPEVDREKEVSSLMDQLSEDNMSKLSKSDVIALECRLKLLVEDEVLTDEQRSLLTSLSPQNIGNLSQQEVDANVKALNAATTREDTIAYLLDQLSPQKIDRLGAAQVVAMQSRLKLLIENGTISEEERSLLTSLTEVNKLSKEEVQSKIARLNALAESSEKELTEAVPSTENKASSNTAALTEEDKEVAFLSQQLSSPGVDQLSQAQVMALQSKLKLIVEKDTITDEERTLLTQLSENVDDLSGDQVVSILSKLRLLGNKDSLNDEERTLLTQLSENMNYLQPDEVASKLERLNELAPSGSPSANILATKEARQLHLLKQLRDDNIDDLTEEQQQSIIKELKLENEDGTIESPAKKYAHLLESPEDEDSRPEISKKEMALLTKLSDDNIKNLSDEEIINIAGQLDLIGPNGDLLDPSRYPFSRANYAADLAAARARAAQEEAEEEYEEGEQDEENEQPEVEDEEDLSGKEEMDKYFDEVIDPSPLPTEPLPYTPKENTTDELRLDWPNTPLSGSGLTESVIQKVTWLAKRLPHGHWTPSQIAERYEEGYMVRFNSEEEKETVLKVAADLANARAAKMSERTGEDLQPSEMGFSSLLERSEEKKRVIDSMARGVYDVPGKQSNQVMDGVMRQLSNNETYRSEDAEKFKGRIEKLIGMVGGGRGKGQGAQAGAGKK